MFHSLVKVLLGLTSIFIFSSCDRTLYSYFSYEHTSQIGPVVWEGELDGYRCQTWPAKEVGLATEAVLFSLDEFGIINYSNDLFETLQLFETEHGPYVCFVPDGGLGPRLAGMSRGKGVWVSTTDRESRPYDPGLTALPHELIHHLLARSCALADCDGDADHNAPDVWGPDGAEGLAYKISALWR